MTFSSLAILVDGDNISSTFAGQVLRNTKDLGPNRMRLAFCNTQSVGDWTSAPSFRVIHSGSGRNSSDILLSIHAVKFALRDGIEAFAIVTSDGDLSHIAHALREMGRHVVGVGEAKAPKAFRLACHSFIELRPPAAKIAEARLDPMDMVVRQVLLNHDPTRQGILVPSLNALVRRENNSIKISEREERTWPRYLAARPDLYTLTGDGKDRRVRIAAASEDA